MKTPDYHRLLAELCTHLNLQDEATLQTTALLRVGEHDLLLQHDEVNLPHAIQAQLDLGPFPQDRHEWGWFRLLTSNYQWGSNGVLGWGLTPEDNHVVLTALHPFDEHTTAAEVARWLRTLGAAGPAHRDLMLGQQDVADTPWLGALFSFQRPFESDTGGRWVDLVDALCSRVSTVRRDDLLGNAATMRIEGIGMRLAHDPTLPGQFQVHLNLGMEIADTREKLWQGLLLSNFLMGSGGRLLFSVHPKHDAVVLTLQQDIPAQGDADDFVNLLRGIAIHARTLWTDTRETIERIQSLERQAHHQKHHLK